jgi:DNA recombination-dependent growth factor C
MGMLRGPVTARRYTVLGDAPEGFRITYVEALNAYAFTDAVSQTSMEERAGWVLSQNLLDNDFTDLNGWLFNHYAYFHLRVDKKSLPVAYFKAHLEKRCEAWCQEHGREKVPKGARTELKDQLEFEWLQRTLPRVKVLECCWNMAEGVVWFSSLSDKENDRFRKLFHQTFGLQLMPCNPLDLLGDDDLAVDLEQTGGSDLSVDGGNPRIVEDHGDE